MSRSGFGDPSRTATMGCASCDVTWRGCADDECWSCGDSVMVTEAVPRKVRLTPAASDMERLVG